MFGLFDRRIKNLDTLDIGLTKLSVFFATIVAVKIFPSLTRLDYSLLIALTLLMALRPLYKLWKFN
jgi:hypothetical protein